MRVIVVGGGIIGLATAFYLNAHGVSVQLIEREADVARMTSKGNAGVISPGCVTPWAAPGMPFKIVKYLWKPHSPLIYRPQWNGRQWIWVRRWLRECAVERFNVNKQRMQRIAYYSQRCLAEFRGQHEVGYWRNQGFLQVYRSEFDVEMAQPGIRVLQEAGIAHRVLTGDAIFEVEPSLRWSTVRPAAALHLPDDETGDCAVFASRLRAICATAGVEFLFDTEVCVLDRAGDEVNGIVARRANGVVETLHGDAVIVAGGVDSVTLLAPLGVDVPLYPVKGYSATLPVKDEAKTLRAAVMDEALKVGMTRMGPVVRVAGTAELGDCARALRAKATATLIKTARDWFPEGVDFDTDPRFWVGLRPMTPDGPPILGATPFRRLYVNVGHGSTGWAMAMGSGRVVADVVTGRTPAIDLSGLTLERYA
ncbi:D-amino acid dehydrogenase [Paraburkholderia sp.]|uniref:D-amino acid dehydrogenase n=1 Tax=Paraburkholderia sp. TaxID=1926495 RepID=UPI0039E6FBA5